jgi:hypothetical protein
MLCASAGDQHDRRRVTGDGRPDLGPPTVRFPPIVGIVLHPRELPQGFPKKLIWVEEDRLDLSTI